MASTPRSPGFWQSLRQLPERTPLRVRLITAILALVAIALAVISVAGITILKDSLLGPYDSGLAAYIGPAENAVVHYLNTGNPNTGNGDAVDWVTGGRIHQVIVPTSGEVPDYGGLGPQPRQIAGPKIPTNSGWLAANTGHPITVPATSGTGHWRVLMQTVVSSSPGAKPTTGTVVLAYDVTGVYNTIGQLTTVDLVVSLGIIFLLGIIGIAVIRASLRPLVDIEQTAGAIAAGDLTRRVPERDPRTEVGRLGRSLNVMLSQIEAAFLARSRSEAAARRSEQRMRQFVADASHELRTPLTAIRGFAEYYRQRGGTFPESTDAPQASRDALASVGLNGTGKLAATDLDRIMRRVEQESARMGVLVEDMLLLARLDQQRPLEHNPVDLLTLAADAVHDARVVAPNRSINLSVGAGAALLVNGDEVRLRQVIGNLMSNALAHTPDGTAIDVRIRSGSRAEIRALTAPAGQRQADDLGPESDQAADGSYTGAEAEPGAWPGARAGESPEDAANAPSAAVLEVTDYGSGLTREQARHAFERFYRADQARTSGGTGLGLAIVAALVKAHGGAVWVKSQPGAGATFSIALPLAPEAVQDAGHEDDTAEAEFPDSEAAEPEAADPDAARLGQEPTWTESDWAGPGHDRRS